MRPPAPGVSPAPLEEAGLGALPAGLSLNPATGMIEGTPESAGSFGFGLSVTVITGPANRALDPVGTDATVGSMRLVPTKSMTP